MCHMVIRNRIRVFFKNVFVRDTISLTGVFALGKGIGLFIPFFIALWFGTGGKLDAFFFAYGLVLFFSALITSTISSMIVPSIIELETEKKEVGRFLGSLFIWSTIGFTGIALLSLFLLGPVLSAITKFQDTHRALVTMFCTEMLPLVLLLIYSSILDGFFNARKKYIVPGLLSGVRSVIVIVFIFLLKDRIGVHAVSFGYCMGEALRFALLLVYLKSAKLLKFRFSFKIDERWHLFLKLSLFQTIAMIVSSINPIVDRSIASWLGEGAISVLYYADRLNIVFNILLSGGVIVVLLSHLSSVYNTGALSDFRTEVIRAARGVGILTLVIEIALILCASLVVKVALDRGAFEKAFLGPVEITFICYMAGFVFNMTANVFARAHLVMKNTKTILINSIIVCILNVLLDLLLIRCLGIAGIALSTSIANGVAAVYLILMFRKEMTMRGVGK
jgi:putative peptidoglycan lipid II flippase